jgi:hypothetical protein
MRSANLESEARAMRKSGKRDRVILASASWLKAAARISELFKLRLKADAEAVNRIRKGAERAERELAKRRELGRIELEKRRTENLAFYRSNLEAWIAGGDEKAGLFNLRPKFRTAKGVGGEDILESSHGAEVPLEHAKKAISFALAKRQSGWTRGETECRVGLFALDAIDGDGVHAGCHHIDWAEVERLNQLLNQ